MTLRLKLDVSPDPRVHALTPAVFLFRGVGADTECPQASFVLTLLWGRAAVNLVYVKRP